MLTSPQEEESLGHTNTELPREYLVHPGAKKCCVGFGIRWIWGRILVSHFLRAVQKTPRSGGRTTQPEPSESSIYCLPLWASVFPWVKTDNGRVIVRSECENG